MTPAVMRNVSGLWYVFWPREDWWRKPECLRGYWREEANAVKALDEWMNGIRNQQ